MKVLSFLILATTIISCSSSSPSKVVETAIGKLQGYEQNEINYFLGIPYAEPPLGELRWQPPKPMKSWEGIKEVNAHHRSYS